MQSPERSQVLGARQAAELEDVDPALKPALAAQDHAMHVGVVGRLARGLAQRQHQVAG